jgi:hypothetical protein
MRMRCPIALAGKFLLNLALTAPLVPCGLVTLPQIALTLDFTDLGFPGTQVLFLALYT